MERINNDLSYYLEKDKGFHELIEVFFKYLKDNEYDIYNEDSFKFELGIFLRSIDFNRKYKIEFERNVKCVLDSEQYLGFNKKYAKKTKKEIDIYIYEKNSKYKYAIELKYPKNGAFPNEMYECVKDIKFMQILKNYKFTKTYCITLVGLDDNLNKHYNPELFYKGFYKSSHIFKYFRMEDADGKIIPPSTLTDKVFIDEEKHPNKFIDLGDFSDIIEWKRISENDNYFIQQARYYIIEISKEVNLD